jgi:beta-N-acetylhexosaminidase
VADVNNNPENPIINIRSFGENPQDVAAHVQAFIDGAHADKRNYVLTTAKHFPGHGDTAVDTHLSLAQITADRARLDALELVPFRAAIQAGVDSVMTGHIAVPALAPEELPATLSPAILTGLLRNELGFKGLVITDALGMGAIVNGFGAGDAAVRALEAGADALLMPADADVAIRAVVAAVQSGRLARARIQQSVVKLLAAKERLGLDRKRAVDVESIGDVIDDPAVNEKAQEIADRAVTLVRNNGSMLPLAAPDRVCFVTMTEGRYSTDGVTFAQEVRKRAPKVSLTSLDGTMMRAQVDDLLLKMPACAQYAVAAYAPANAGAGTGMSSELSRHRHSDRGGKAAGSGGLGQSVPAAGLSESDSLPGNLQQCSAVGDCGGESALGRDRHSRPPAGDDSRRGAVWRRNTVGGYPRYANER